MCSRRAAPATRSMLEVHKELSNSYREGIDEKLKCMAQPYKTKVFKKSMVEVDVDGIEMCQNSIGRA